MSEDAKDTRARPGPIVRLGPPSAAVRDSVLRLLIEMHARRALIELGVLPENQNEIPG